MELPQQMEFRPRAPYPYCLKKNDKQKLGDDSSSNLLPPKWAAGRAFATKAWTSAAVALKRKNCPRQQPEGPRALPTPLIKPVILQWQEAACVCCTGGMLAYGAGGWVKVCLGPWCHAGMTLYRGAPTQPASLREVS